ncbi:MAG: acyl carrier protein [Anaerolineales bacterium]|nr:acyl carrier protein [Anaerolineales bacterium]
MSEEIIAKLSRYITSDILKQPNRKIDPDEPLLSSGLIDSFHLVDLALFVEDNFGVHIDDAELSASTFDSLNQLAAFIQQRK